jgi:hypothetical protein
MYRVHIHGAQHGTRGASASGHRAIDHHHVLVGPAPVDVKAAIADAGGIEGADTLPADHARRQRSHINWVAAVQGEVLDLLGVDRSSDVGGIGLDLRGRSLHRHLVGDRADSQRCAYADLCLRVQDDAGSQELLEALSFGSDGVAADE